ncbi:MAG: replication-relaxation family protein, partial [Actinobacteria bacterium]|nr:replication-relaxation family protein [Actinomycetota bacterium]
MTDMAAAPAPRSAPRQIGVEMMASLYQHRLLSTEQLRAMHCPGTSEQWGRQVLRELKDAGYVTSTNKRGGAPGEPMRLWFLTEFGASTVELTPQGEDRRIIVSDAGAAGQLQAHTLGVNDVAIAFMRAARARDDICGALAWRHEVAHNIGGGTGRR